ncbi:MAG: methylisocitrate lyase [Candidatus Hydrogenedentes bacterium]|nr:methylisocitrate lyase [Candidatus Hydrogenedentota bacterium]
MKSVALIDNSNANYRKLQVIPSAARSAKLRHLLEGKCVTMPGAVNALSARLIEQMGFDAMYLSGAVLANSVGGMADVGLMTLSESEAHSASIARVTSIPIIADADTGYGEADNAARTVQVLEQAGVSGIHLEDQVFPKRCGHLEGKELVEAHDFCRKIATAKAAKTSEDFLLIARTDARGVVGIEETIRRANLYVEAGADAIFPEGLRSADEFRQVAGAVDTYLLANMTEFGTTPYLTVNDFAALGYNMVIFPVTLQRTAMKAMEDVLRLIRDTGSQEPHLEHMQTRQELYDLLEYGGKVNAPAPR